MYNYFRTLFLNLSYDAMNPDEHIPPGFVEQQLPDDVKACYDLFFPPDATRFYKRFLVHGYLSLLESSGLNNDILAFDPRITYDLSEELSFFKFNRFSEIKYGAVAGNSDFTLLPAGKYNARISLNDHFDRFTITQTSNSPIVTITSVSRGAIQTSSGSYNHTLTFGAYPSDSSRVYMSDTGLSFVIWAPTSFTASSSKTWEFSVDAPFYFDFVKLINRLSENSASITNLFAVKSSAPLKFENMWSTHFNSVYKTCGLLMALGYRLKDIYEKGKTT